jgi:hypothetical protein
MAKLDPTPYPLPPIDYAHFGRDGAHEKAFDALAARSATLGEGEYVGALINWQIADGYASYLVTSMRPVTLQHVPFGDAYTVHPETIRGLRKADVIEKVNQARAFRRLFSSR